MNLRVALRVLSFLIPGQLVAEPVLVLEGEDKEVDPPDAVPQEAHQLLHLVYGVLHVEEKSCTILICFIIADLLPFLQYFIYFWSYLWSLSKKRSNNKTAVTSMQRDASNFIVSVCDLYVRRKQNYICV